MRAFLLFTHFFSAAVLVRFVLSKLQAWPVSVAAFIEMAKPIGIDPTFFRLFTGITLAFVVTGYAVSFLLLAKNGFANKKGALRFIKASNVAGFTVMIGALLSEFFLRVSPKWPLVGIAAAIVAFSAFSLLRLRETTPAVSN